MTYTDKQIIEALEVRMPHDLLCREAYDLIQRQRAELAREIFGEVEKSVALKMPARITPIFKRDLDYSHGVIDGERSALFEVLVLLAEIEKKYTESVE